MSINKRNIDTSELSKDSPGPIRLSGTGTHEAHQMQADQAAEDPQRRGLEGHKAGSLGQAELQLDADEEVDPDAPMSEEQKEHLRILCEEMGEPFDPWLTHSSAERRIRALRRRAGHKP